MTTENERVAGYIIPELYERFDQFCQENKLSCSRALNVIIAEYFGLEEALIFKQTWAGGITLPEFKKLKQEVGELSKLKQEVEQLKKLVNTLSNIKSIIPKNKELSEQINEVLPEPINEDIEEEQESKKEINEAIPEKISKKVKNKINEVLSKSINEDTKEKINQSNDEQITLELNTSELAKRFNISRATINRNKKKFRENKITKKEYIEWTRSKDPEGKGWFFDENTNYSV